MKSTGVVRRIDDLGRIVIPKEIRKTLRIRDGESLEIFTDNEAITLKKFSVSNDLTEISQALLDTVSNTIRKNMIVTDRDYVIAASGDLKKDFLGKPISKILESYLLEREKVVKKEFELNQILEIETEGKEKYNYILFPILADGEAVGLVLMIEDHLDLSFSEEEKKIIKIVAQFLGKYIEE